MKHEEDAIQEALVMWIQITYPYLLFTCAPATSKSAREGSKKKKMGYRPGWPDLFLAIPQNGYYGLFIELKKPDGKLSAIQKEILQGLNDQGYKAVAAYSFDEARDIIRKYIK